MEWWQQSVVVPVKRAWMVVTARLRRKKDDGRGAALLKLHDDIQTCGYEDVKVMWEMLQRSETERLACEPSSKGARALVWLRRRHHKTDRRRRG